MLDLQHQPNKLMFDEETLKLSTKFYDNNHDKNITPLQDMEKKLVKKYIKSLVRAKY